MRILYVSHTHPPKGTILDNAGGMQRVSRQLIDEFRNRSDVDIFTHTINVSGKTVPFQTTGFLLKSLLTLSKKVRQCDADIILFSSMVTASLAWFLCKKIDVPMVTINHGRDVTLEVSIYQNFLPRVFSALDGVISVSRATRQECVKRGMDPNKGVALANGFNLETMKNLPAKESSRLSLHKKFNIPLQNKKMLLTVGRKVKRKGHEWFIRNVLPKVTREVVYVTIGDGPELENAEQAANESKDENIFLLGRQPDEVLQQAYAAADLFIMPNIPVSGDMEGFGIVLLEANMAQTPAVASDLEGIKDVISQGKNGYKVPVKDAEKFAAKINEVLNDNLEHLSGQTRSYVEDEFSWNRVAGQYVDFLCKIRDSYTSNKSKN